MKILNTFLGLVVLYLFTLDSGTLVHANDLPKLKVVTTLSTYADIASAVGGNYVAVSSIAPARFNPHFIEPKPTDVLKVQRADLFIRSGLDLEVWVDALINATGKMELRTGGSRNLELSQAVNILNIPTTLKSRAEGDIHLYGNPHYWLDPRNAIAIAKLIAKTLGKIDPPHLNVYESNRDIFVNELKEKMAEWDLLIAAHKGTELLAYHDEWAYLANFLGLRIAQFVEPKPGIPPGPRHIEFLRSYIPENALKLLVQSSFHPTAASEALAKDTGIKLAILCQNVGELDSCSNYIAMLDHNIKTIVETLK